MKIVAIVPVALTKPSFSLKKGENEVAAIPAQHKKHLDELVRAGVIEISGQEPAKEPTP